MSNELFQKYKEKEIYINIMKEVVESENNKWTI